MSLCITRVGTKSVDFTYTIEREKDQVLFAEGLVTVVTVDMTTMKSIPIPPDYRDLFEVYAEEFCATGGCDLSAPESPTR